MKPRIPWKPKAKRGPSHTSDDLRSYQWDAFWWAFRKRFAALFMDMGLGKTIVVLSVIKAMFHKGILTKPVLLVGPIRVIYGVWMQEALDWSHTRTLTFSVVHGSVKQRMDALSRHADVYLINPENLRWLLRLYRSKKARLNWPWDGLVIDESSAFKRAGAKRFRTLRHYVRLFKKLRLILSGTPTPNSLLELWTQMFIVDMGARLGSTNERYVNRFFQPSFDGYGYDLRDGSEEYIYDLIGDVALSMEAKDHLKGLPPTIINPVYVELPAEARRIYDKFEREMFVQLRDGDLQGLTPATVSMKCWQIANGAAYIVDRETGENTSRWEHIHDAKIEALQEIIDETGSPILIGYWFKHDLARLRATLPKAPHFRSTRDTVLEDEWNAGKHPQVMIHPLGAAHGMNLQKGPGCTVTNFSLMWSNERFRQLYNRVGGARARQRVMVHCIIARDTVDEVMFESVQRKETGQRALFSALNDYRRHRESRHR